MHARRFLSLIALAAIAIIVLLSLVGCTKDRPTGPIVKPSAAAKAVVRGGTGPISIGGEKDYPMIYSRVGNDYWVYTYSSKTGQVVDSARYGHTPFEDVRFSSDGRYACYSNQSVPFGGPPSATWVTDFRTGDTLSILRGVWGHWLSVSSDDRYLLVSFGTSVRLCELPSLNIICQIDRPGGFGQGALHPKKKIAYVTVDKSDTLLVINFETDLVQTSSVVLRAAYGGAVWGLSAAVTPDGGTLLVIADVGLPAYRGVLQLIDTRTFKLIRETGPVFQSFAVHPSGDRIFFWEPSMSLYHNIASLWVLDLRTFHYERILCALDIQLPWPFRFNPSTFYGLDITPDGKYAFIINGGEGFEYGPIMKVDLRTYKIVDQFYPPEGRSRLIRINPHEIKEGTNHVPDDL